MDDFDQLVTALEAAGCIVRGKSVVCSFHGDHDASGSIYPGADGRPRYKCHGCDAHGDAADIIARHTGRPLAEVLKERANSDRPTAKTLIRPAAPKQTWPTLDDLMNGRRDVVAVFDYSPSPLRVIRINPKAFPQVHQQPDGRWAYGGVPDPQPLYHADEIVRARLVIVTEGEKDADALLSLGFTATTVPMGADTVGTPVESDGKPGKADWSALAHRTAVLWPDDDEPGQRHMQRAARILGRLKGCRVLMIGKAGHKDAAELIAAHPDDAKQVIEELIAKAEPADPRTALAITYFAATIETRPDWIWPGHLLHGAAHVVGGKQGSSKGLFTVDIAARITRGDVMPDGTGGGNPGRVLIVTREDSPEMALMPRLRVAGADMAMVAWTHGDFADGTPIPTMREGVVAIEGAVRDHGFDLVIIDPLGAWVEDDMNNGQQIRAVVDPMSRMAREIGCAVLFVCHLRKAAADDPMDAFAGSAQVTAAVRVAMLISSTADGHERVLEVAKTNFRKPDGPLIYAMQSVGGSDRDEPPTLVWRLATSEDKASAAASKRGTAPIVPLDFVQEHLPADHRPFDEVARAAHKAALATMPNVTLQGVKDAIVGLISAGRAHEGTGRRGVRTVGRGAAPVVLTMEDKAADYWAAHPGATVREVASAVGCGKSVADRAKRLVDVSPSSVPHVDLPPAGQGTEQRDKAAKSCPPAAPAPLRGRGTEGRDTQRGREVVPLVPARVRMEIPT